jgi:hypothetical protein
MFSNPSPTRRRSAVLLRCCTTTRVLPPRSSPTSIGFNFAARFGRDSCEHHGQREPAGRAPIGFRFCWAGVAKGNRTATTRTSILSSALGAGRWEKQDENVAGGGAP